MQTDQRDENDSPQAPIPPWTLGTTVIACLLAAFAVGGIYVVHTSPPPAQVVAEIP